jgi:hypothetical protein
MMRAVVMAAFTAALMVSSVSIAQGPPARTRGTIVSVDGDTIELQTRRGEKVAVHLGDKTPVVGVANAKLSDLKPGRFIGTTAAPQPDGTLKAVEIHAFPESMRGTGEGHYSWDLGETSTMTNGSIGTFAGTSGHTMTVTYNGGEKIVVVPDDVPVVELRPGDRTLLKAGARAFAVGPKAADGSVTALRLYVGENGVVPPM